MAYNPEKFNIFENNLRNYPRLEAKQHDKYMQHVLLHQRSVFCHCWDKFGLGKIE